MHGVEHAKGDFIVIMDADLSHHVNINKFNLKSKEIKIKIVINIIFISLLVNEIFKTYSQSSFQNLLSEYLIITSKFKIQQTIILSE